MWTVKYFLRSSEQEKIFYDLIRLRSFLISQEANPNFKLVEVKQLIF